MSEKLNPNIEIETFCPLGKRCERISKDGQRIQRCSWYQLIKGQHPQTGEIIDEWGCAVTWINVLMIEQTKNIHSSAAAIESFRNETVKGLHGMIAVASRKQIQ